MREHFAMFVAVMVGVLALSISVPGQNSVQNSGPSKGSAASKPAKTAPPPDRGGLMGIWGPAKRSHQKYLPPEASHTLGNSWRSVSTEPEPPLTEWAKENLVFKEGITHGPKINPDGAYPGQNCVPIAMPAQHSYSPRLYPFELVETRSGDRIVQFMEYHREWREIWMDGRPHPGPDELTASWFGHSIGWWEGKTLVVDTVGFNGRTWIDQNVNLRLSDAARVVERYQRIPNDIMRVDITVYDPKAWGEGVSWGGLVRAYQSRPDMPLDEFVCTVEDNTGFDKQVTDPIVTDSK
jgi:hypothetical protein